MNLQLEQTKKMSQVEEMPARMPEEMGTLFIMDLLRYTLSEKFWRISLHVTEDAIVKRYMT